MAAPQPEPMVHIGPWTLDEWLALPEGPPYTELVDGLLVMSPISGYRHQRSTRSCRTRTWRWAETGR